MTGVLRKLLSGRSLWRIIKSGWPLVCDFGGIPLHSRPQQYFGRPMKTAFVSLLALIAIWTTNATAQGIVSLQFEKDTCEKFQQSESSDQDMYVIWAVGHIQRNFGIKVDMAALKAPLQNYCAAHPTLAFVDATVAVKDQLIGNTKP